jgi:hypothetical protein
LESPELPRLQSNTVGALTHAAGAGAVVVVNVADGCDIGVVLVGCAARLLLGRTVDGSERGHVVYYRRNKNVLIDLSRKDSAR